MKLVVKPFSGESSMGIEPKLRYSSDFDDEVSKSPFGKNSIANCLGIAT